jgi:hypothetical protein
MNVATQAAHVEPSDLVMLPFREVECDDTMREFRQVLRFDLINGRPLRAQLLLDRRHKSNKALSKPVAYFRMSSTDQLIKLGNTALGVATALAFAEMNVLEPSYEQIKSAVKSLLQQFSSVDIENLVGLILSELRKTGT